MHAPANQRQTNLHVSKPVARKPTNQLTGNQATLRPHLCSPILQWTSVAPGLSYTWWQAWLNWSLGSVGAHARTIKVARQVELAHQCLERACCCHALCLERVK